MQTSRCEVPVSNHFVRQILLPALPHGQVPQAHLHPDTREELRELTQGADAGDAGNRRDEKTQAALDLGADSRQISPSCLFEDIAEFLQRLELAAEGAVYQSANLEVLRCAQPPTLATTESAGRPKPILANHGTFAMYLGAVGVCEGFEMITYMYFVLIGSLFSAQPI